MYTIDYAHSIPHQVFYYSTVAEMFSNKRRSVKTSESREKLPTGVTAAFSMPNQMLYLFRSQHFCKRDLYYDRIPAYVRMLFGDSVTNLFRYQLDFIEAYLYKNLHNHKNFILIILNVSFTENCLVNRHAY